MQKQCFVGCFAICASLWAFGCGSTAADDASTTTSAALTSEPCTPSEGYDTCAEIDAVKAPTWQETVASGEADDTWRTVVPSEIEGVDYEVTIDLTGLNDGLIPTAQGQGHYGSEEEFIKTMEHELLGMKEGESFILEVSGGSTAKLVEDRSAISEASTGNFLVDALTDEEGSIYIDGKLRDDVLFKLEPDETEIINEDESSSVMTNQSAVSRTLRARKYTAKQKASAFNASFFTRFSGGVKDVKKDGKRCRWTWKFWKGFRECYKATMDLTNSHLDGSGRRVFDRRGRKSGVESYTISYYDWHWGPRGKGPVREVCNSAFVTFPNSSSDSGTLCDDEF